MTTVPRETLAECLELLEQGLSVDQVLLRFPGQSAALRPFLETAVHLSGLAQSPAPAVTRQSRRVVLQEVDALGGGHAPGAVLGSWLRQSLVPAFSFALLLLLFVVALPRLSASALPGDSLYGGKRLVERAQLFFASSPEQRAALQARFDDERIREVVALLDSGREAEVAFEGTIADVQPAYWTVAGIRVNLSQDTAVEGEPWPLGRARVQGRTQDGRLHAARLVVFGEPPPLPAPTATATPTLAAPATETATPTATATPSPTATATPTATGTASPTPTATLQPVPTWTPPLGDAGNDNGNENDNENDNGNDNGNENDNDNGNENDNANEDDDDGNQNDGG